jgi:hypothetical protein
VLAVFFCILVFFATDYYSLAMPIMEIAMIDIELRYLINGTGLSYSIKLLTTSSA